MKKIIFMIMMAFAAISMNAQTAVQTSKLFDNVYVGVGGQASVPLSFNKVFPLNSAVALTLGKEFTPVVGANLEGDFWLGSRIDNRKGTRFDFDNGPHNAVRGSYLGLNSTVNFTNLFKGYTGTPRKFEMQSVVGLGWFHTFRPGVSDRMKDDLAAKTGLNFNFNLGQNKAHTIYLQPAILWNLTNPASKHDHVALNKNGAQFALGLGYAYHFKTSNGTHAFKLWDVGAMNDEINNLKAELAKKPNEVVREVVREVVVPKVIKGNEYVVYFSQNSDVLTDEAKVVLDNIKGSVVIDGYASPEGTEQYNKELSQRRANVVSEYLRAKGVMVGNVVGRGVVGETSNRVAIITVQ